MAVIINLTDSNGSKTEHFKQEKIPATQGNVINTLNAYNEKIKKEYYDKKQARADENALQESIQKIVQLLAANTNFKDKTLAANTNSEDIEKDRLEKYSGSFSEDKDVEFDVAGLVRKINIIANILSGDTESSKQWKVDVHGNNIGKEESTLNVPVIGITRGETDYKATFNADGDNRTLTISGLNEIDIVRPNGNTDTIAASEMTVLSEKQVAEMICCSVKSVLGGFDSQIANIVSYLLFQEGDLPDSYKFVLNHTNDEKIKSAPLYVTYEVDQSRIGEKYTAPAYYIHDLNGNIKETVDYVINASNITDLTSGNGWKPTEASLFTLKANEKLDKINVFYNGTEVYTLSVPKKTLTLNLHDKTRIKGTISYSYSVLGQTIRDDGVFEFNEDGIAYENFPQGSTVTIKMPGDFTDTLFCEENYTEGVDTGVSSVDLSKEDAHVYNKKIIFNFEDDEPHKEIIYYSSGVSLSKSLRKVGYKATLESVFGVGIKNNVLEIPTNKIWEKVSANTDEFTFDCNITWENREVKVTLKYLEGGQEKEDTMPLLTGQEILPKDITGYDFKGWEGTNDKKSYTTVPFEDIDNLKLTAVQTLKKYNCIYDLNGGSWNTVVTPSLSYTHSHTFTDGTDNQIPTTVSRPGYNFVGWYTRPELENDGYKVTHFQNEDCTYYAKWEEKNYTINFELDTPKQLEDGANPMFKYQSLTVKASNLPITLGQAYATGYDFVGWAKTESLSSLPINTDNLDSYAKVTSLEIRDFTDDTINLSAVWKAKEVPVIEEYYYEIDGQSDKYDLLETSKNEAKVGELYKATAYTANNGFEENTGKEQSLTVMPTGNVYKRYFDRGTFTVTYKGIAETDIERTYTYSDNAQELASIKELTSVDNSLFDCWLKVETNENKTPIKHISAYHFENIQVEARYNQDAPLLTKDFKVTTTTNTITITNNNSNGKAIIINDGTLSNTIPYGDSRAFDYSSVYPSDANTTKSCFVSFVGDTNGTLNESKSVEIPLIYENTKPVKGTDYDLDSATSTVKKLPDKEGLEYRIGDSNYFELASDTHIERNKTIYIRKKATFSRFASADVSESFNEKAAAVETALVDSNFKVVNVSYKEQGHIEIKDAVFEGNHGALQYKTGSGNAWLDVNKVGEANESTTLYVDKPCTVSFRYNESDEYRASSKTLNLTVVIKTHTVTFDVSNIPSKEYNFTGLTQGADTEKLTLLADSGSQLCKVEGYIKNVDNWTVTGYLKDIDTKLGRAVSFLKKSDGTYYNEASVIDSDITLLMNWKPIQFNNVNYTDAVLLGDALVNLPESISNNYTRTFSYGEEVRIDLINNLTMLVGDNSTLEKILNALDTNTDKLLSLEKVYYKTGNSSYTDTGVVVTTNNTSYSFPYFNGTPDFSQNTDSFPYKFASKFEFVEANGVESAIIQFINDVDTGEAVGKVKSVSYYGGTDLENFKFNLVSNSTLHVYYASDPRASNYSKLAEFTATENTNGLGRTLTVIFHSAYIDGKFYPRKEVPGIIAIKQTITDQNSIYSMSVNGGSTVITPTEGWTITTTNVPTYPSNSN